ncbi:MAG: hypothetical protein O7A06_03250 [Acidobacteria bacterium]|nr:hypothetical protein [Acidobacteriota bacterium]MCZ6752510.1 hypothetical protein [Acidobacteriota bacterium]
MKQVICPQEGAVSKAARKDQWEESLTAHVAGCPSCREIVQTSRWMQALAQRSETDMLLPDAGLLWWRAHLSQIHAHAERAQKPLVVVEVISEATIALAPIALALAGWLTWNWSEAQGLGTKLLAGLLSQLWKTDWLAGWAVMSSLPALSPFVVLSLIVSVLSLAVFLVAYPLLSED